MNNKYLIPLSIIIAAFIIGGAIILKDKNTNKGNTQVESGKASIEIDINRNEILGNKNAKVSWVEFGDYQCPYCKKLHSGARKEIIKKYVDSGKINMVFKNFAFLGEESVWAAEAALCAKDQGKFWDYHDLLFEKQSGENQGTFKKDNLIKWAAELGLNVDEFKGCLDSEVKKSEIQKDYEEGIKVGVEGTPTVFINGEKMGGVLPVEKYEEVIEKFLNS